MSRFFYKNFVLTIIFSFVILSCSITKNVLVEFPEPAEDELPPHIESLLLVNRTLNNQYSNLEADSLQKIFYELNFKTDTIIYDIQSADTMLKALGELLYESGRFDYVIPEKRFLKAKRNAFFTNKMPLTEVKQLCETFHTDAILSVDMYKTQIATNYTEETFFDYDANVFRTGSVAQMGITYDVLFRIYDPLNEKVIVRKFLKDTLIWEDWASTARELFHNFTTVKQGLAETGIAVALNMSGKISPGWRQETRPFYVKGDKILKNAGTLIDNGNWEQAIELWKGLAEKTKSNSTKSKAMLNIAFAYEIKGDTEQAISWALKSYESMYRQVTYNYLEFLKRKKEQQKQNK